MRLSSSLQILRPCSHSLSRRLLFWITYITTDITFFPFYIDFLFLTSIQLIITPSLSRWMWLFPHIRRNPEWLTSHTEVSNRKREREWSSNLISLDFIFIHIHYTQKHFLTPWSYMSDPGVTDAWLCLLCRVMCHCFTMWVMGCDEIPRGYNGSRDRVFITSLADYGRICYGLNFRNVSQSKGA